MFQMQRHPSCSGKGTFCDILFKPSAAPEGTQDTPIPHFIDFGSIFGRPIIINSNNNGIFIAAAGNKGKDSDKLPIYPASYELNNII